MIKDRVWQDINAFKCIRNKFSISIEIWPTYLQWFVTKSMIKDKVRQDLKVLKCIRKCDLLLFWINIHIQLSSNLVVFPSHPFVALSSISITIYNISPPLKCYIKTPIKRNQYQPNFFKIVIDCFQHPYNKMYK